MPVCSVRYLAVAYLGDVQPTIFYSTVTRRKTEACLVKKVNEVLASGHANIYPRLTITDLQVGSISYTIDSRYMYIVVCDLGYEHRFVAKCLSDLETGFRARFGNASISSQSREVRDFLRSVAEKYNGSHAANELQAVALQVDGGSAEMKADIEQQVRNSEEADQLFEEIVALEADRSSIQSATTHVQWRIWRKTCRRLALLIFLALIVISVPVGAILLNQSSGETNVSAPAASSTPLPTPSKVASSPSSSPASGPTQTPIPIPTKATTRPQSSPSRTVSPEVSPLRSPNATQMPAPTSTISTPSFSTTPIPTPSTTALPKPSPSGSSAASPTNSTNAANPKESNGMCVTKVGKDFSNPQLPPGWTVSGNNGITYKEGDTSTEVDLKPKSVVSYSFKVPVRGHYGVVLDMETRHATEHNDVYVSCEGGLTMRRFGKYFEEQEFVKVYHNMNGRAVQSFNKDFDPHALSTSAVLEPGVEYKCSVAGRSTMTTVHALILFPCEGAQCEATSAHWQRSVQLCSK